MTRRQRQPYEASDGRRTLTLEFHRPPWPDSIWFHHRGDPVEVEGETWELERYFMRNSTLEEFEEYDQVSTLVVHLIQPAPPDANPGETRLE